MFWLEITGFVDLHRAWHMTWRSARKHLMWTWCETKVQICTKLNVSVVFRKMPTFSSSDGVVMASFMFLVEVLRIYKSHFAVWGVYFQHSFHSCSFFRIWSNSQQTFCFCSHSWDGLKIWAHCWDVVWRTNCSCCGDETCDPAVAWQSRSVFHFKFQQSQNTTRVNCRLTYVQVISSALCGSGSQFFKWWISNFGDKFISSCVPLSCLTSSTASFWYPVSLQNKGFITAAVSFFFLNEIAELLTWRIVQTYTQRLKSIK